MPIQEFVLRGPGPNTMTLESLNALSDFLKAHPSDPIMIYGEGNSFSAGLNLDALIQGDPGIVSAAIEAVAESLFQHPAPTIAAINGHAVAGGCLLAQACDLRIANDNPDIKIGMTGVAIGIVYPPTLLGILRYRIPAHCIDRVLLEAACHSPAAARKLGLVDEVVPDALRVARERIQLLAGHPAQAYAAAKRALRRDALQVSDDDRRDYEEAFNNHWGADSLQQNRVDK